MASYEEIKERLKKYGISGGEKASAEYRTGNDSSVDIVDEEYINRFLSDANDYFTTAEKEYAGLGWSNASSAHSSIQGKWQDLNNRSSYIRQWLEKNKSKLDETAYNNLYSVIDDFKKNGVSVEESFNDAYVFYSQFDSEDSYNKWYTTQQEQKKVMSAEDFADMAKKGADEAMTLNKWGLTSGGKNKIAAYRGNVGTVLSAQGMRGGTVNGEIGLAKAMTEDEANIYNYYFAKYGEDKANEYFDSLKDTLNARIEGTVVENMSKFADEHPVWASTMSPLITTFSAAEYVGDLFTGNQRNMMASANSALRGTVSEKVDWEIGNWDAFDFLYNTAMSGADSLVAGYVFGPAGGVVLGLSAAAQGTNDALDRGLSKDKAFWNGFFSGVFEGLFETVSIGNFNALKEGAATSAKQIAKNIGKSMLVNASEETLTELANIAYDTIANGELSNYATAVSGYMAAGMSESEAKRKAALELAGQVVESGASGALMGAGFGGIGSVKGYRNANKQGNAMYGNMQNELIAEALEVDPNNALAAQLKAKVEGGQKVSGASLYELGQQTEKATVAQDTSKIQAAAEARLSELGETDSIKELAMAIAKETSGEKLTRAEGQLVRSSLYGQRVSNELNPQNIASGGYATEWAEKIGTKRVNREAYNIGIAPTVDSKKTTSGSVSLHNKVDVKEKVSESNETTQISSGEAITIDKSNAIAKVETVDGKRVVYYNTNKGVVEASDVAYANESEGLLYESFADMSPAFANAIIKNYDGSVPMQTYINGMREGVILYGMHNFQAVGKDISKDSNFADLSQADQEYALKLGRTYAKENAEAGSNAIKTAIKNAEARAAEAGADTANKGKGGRVSFENGAKAATKSQRRAVQLAKILSKAVGMDIVFYDATIEGTYGSDANGYFDSKTNTIHLDLQNSKNDAKTIVFTLSHELVHFIKKWSPAKFNIFANFLMEQYAEHGVSTEQLLSNKMAELGTTDADLAYEELIADACERMLLDSNAVVKLAQLRQTDLSLFEKIKMHIADLLRKIRGEYEAMNYAPTSDEAKALQKMEDVLDKMHSLFEEAAVDAAETYQAAKSLNAESVVVSENGTIQLQMKQYQQTGRATLLNYLREQYGDNNANDLIATIDNIYNAMAEIKQDTALSVFGNWQDTEVELDAEGRPIFTTSINNGDYELNQDFSRVCKKRRQLNLVLNMLAEDPAFEASNLTKDDFVKINKAIKEHGFEIACALCFVDSKRFRQSEWADSFANTWNDVLGSIKADSKPLSRFNFATKSVNMADEGIQIDETKPVSYRKWENGKVKETRRFKNIHDLLAHDGNNNVRAIARLLLENPKLRHEFRGADIIASDGFDSIQRLAPDVRGILDGWGGSSVPKPSSNDAIYDNSVLNIAGYNAKKAFAVGGVRMNSFSDFMAHMFFDYAQAFADLSAKGLPMHSYTKELDFARLFGLAGGKVNMSAIAAIRSNAADIAKTKSKADKDAATAFEKSIAGLDISRLAEKLGKDENSITYDDVIENLDDVDYVWADESIDVKSATLLQTGILYDKLTDGQASYCYELIREGKIEEALRVAGKENVNRGYAKHLGIITVGVSKAHILKLLRDPTIRQVIPYHKSGLNPAVAKAMNISLYDDFTNVQNTMVNNGEKQVGIDKDGAKVNGKTLNDFAFYDYFGKTIDGVFYDGKATAAKYLEWCEKGVYDESVGDYVYYLSGGGYILASDFHAKGMEVIPKFSEFASEENYYKLIEDFDCYDTITGEHSAQEAVDLFHDGLPSDYKEVLVRALKAEQKVSDDFKDHLDNKGLRDEIMGIVGKHGYKPSDLAATWGDIVETIGEENVGEATEQLTDVENTTHIKKQKKKASDNTYEGIGKEMLYYEEGNLAPDLTLVETVNERTGKTETTIKHYGQKPKGYIPKKIAYCYKLFEQHPDGTLHALFAGAKGATPIGEWQYAQGFPYTDAGVKGMNLRERYGWHLSAGLPSAPHLMSSKSFERGYPHKNAYGHPKNSKRVWVRMAYDASTDFNTIADSTRAGDIFGLVPFGGYYAFKENNHSEWVISSAVKIDKILTEAERQQILKDAGYDEYEAWRKKHQPTAEEKAERDRAKRIPKAQRDAQLQESSQKMRDAIKSRIIDNPELNGGVKFQKKGVNKDGIEVYETSKETMDLSWKERVSAFEYELNDHYANKTARFVRNGHTYYARLDDTFFDKVVYGESHFSKNGKKAFIKAGADGDVFDLIENSTYRRSGVDTKDHKKKDGFTDYFDYFFKTVQIDNKVFDICVNVKKQYGTKDGYTYTMFLVDNNKIKASPSISTQGAFKSEGNASTDGIIHQKDPVVKRVSQNSENGIMKQVKKATDKDYLDAVKRGDTEAAQKMVDEAARAAGFTVRAYHGTRAFGFTKLDVAKSDDGISFFATDSIVTASAYSSTEEVKRIKDAKPYISDERLMEMEGEIYAAADRAAALCEENLSEQGWEESDVLRGRLENTVVSAESGQIDETTAEKRVRFAFNDMFDTFAEAYLEERGTDTTVEEFKASEEGKQLAEAFFADMPKVVEHVKALLNADGESGIYDLYINDSKHLVIEGKGEDWNRLTAANLPDIHSPEMESYRNISNKDYWTTRSVAQYAKDNGYSGVTFNDIIDGKRESSKVYVALYPQNDVRSADPVTYDDNGDVIPLSKRFDTKENDIRYQKKHNPAEYAPTFYSQMGKVIEGIKMEKIGAASVVSFLKGKGIRHDEIKWSGIEAFLEGKKSVTKAELQEFVAGSQLQIVEQMSDADIDLRYDGSKRAYRLYDSVGHVVDTFTYNEFLGGYVAESDEEIYSNDSELREALREVYGYDSAPKWAEYRLDGGSNYRELVFQMPDSSYSNRAMRVHWGEDVEGVLAHARIQDLSANGGKMLFVEEIQSDWHNEGKREGYSTKEYEDAVEYRDKLYNEYKELDLIFHKYVRSNEFMTDPENVRKTKHDWLRRKVETAQKKHLDAEKVVNSLKEKGAGDTPDAPFRDNYHEYVLKRLIRMAAEEGYDSIGWTTADMQSQRWSDEYAEGYRIEYDQDIPSFLKKYGKKWGATVGKTAIEGNGEITYTSDGGIKYKSIREWFDASKEAIYLVYGDHLKGKLTVKEDGNTMFVQNKETGERYPSRLTLSTGNAVVWSMDITDSMQQSVLYEGQPMFQKKKLSNRTILANALESTIDTSTQEGQNELAKLKEYQSIVGKIEALEAERAELSAKAHELRFQKGRTAEETKRMNSLQFEANQAANRINTYDKQLLRLEAMSPIENVLKREKEQVRKRTEQKGKEKLAAYREKSNDTIRELMERNRESRKKGIESRNKTDMRHKIKSVVSDLNQYLLSGTKERHVPIELQKAVAEALDAVNMDTVGAEERIAKLQADLMKAKTPEAAQAIAKKISHIQEMGGNMSARLQALKDGYDKIINSDDPIIANSHDEALSSKIASVVESVGNTALRDMSLAQLEDVYDMYKAVLHTIRTANKAFKAAKGEEISTLGNRVMEEVDNVGGSKARRIKALDGLKKFAWNAMKPVYAMQAIGSKTLSALYENVRAGEDTWAVDVSEARDFFRDQAKRHGYHKWDSKKQYHFETKRGESFSLTLEQMMSLYAYSKRKQADLHLELGGFVFDEAIEVTEKKKGIPIKYTVNTAKAHAITKETLQSIVAALTPEQRAFVDEMQAYLSTTMGEKGNEVALALYDIKLFKEEHYFPLKSAKQFMYEQNEVAGEVRIKNSGFSKETVAKANNPIILSNFIDVWSQHVNDMSMYHAFVLPLEDFNRVFNYKTPTSDLYNTESVKMYLQNAYGSQSVGYIRNLLTDLNGGARVDSTAGIINKGIGIFKKAAVFASASVVIQQPSAIARATALIDAKYFAGKPSMRKHSEVWAEVKKYAPVAIIKEMGYFDTNMGMQTTEWITSQDYDGVADKMKALVTDGNYRDEILSKAPALADELAWCAIWNAVKRETVHNHKDVRPNSEEFLKLCGERFTEVVTKTQVYDSVLSRSGMMRSKDTGMKMATAFMAEPTTSLNMIANAILQGKRGDKAGAAKAIGSVAASMILNSILVSIVYAGRDDDEDKTYAEKYIGTLTEELIDSFNPLTLIPFVKDIVSIAQGYDVERSDMAVVTDLFTAWENLSSDNRSTFRKVEDFAGAIGAIFGLPVKNIMRDVRGMYNTVNSFINGEETTGAGIKNAVVEAVTGDTKSNGQQLYEAMLSGDQKQIARVKGRFENQKAIDTAIRKALRDNDPRIKEAAAARYNGDIAEYTRIAKQIINEGHFSQDNVVAAINAEINALKPPSTATESSKVGSMYSVDDYYASIVGRDEATAYRVKEDIISTAVANGKTKDEAEKSFNSSFVGVCRDAYEAGEISDSKVIDMLVNYGGKTKDEAYSKVQYWDFKMEYPDYDLSEDAVGKYYDEVVTSGIDMPTYYDYYKQRQECKGTDSNGDGKTDSGSVKAEVMRVIDSLPISSYQKDALYYLNGWSASTIWEAPWH